MEARGEIFTIPVEHGDARNMTLSSGAADHAPVWSPKGNEVAWFSDVDGKGYALDDCRTRWNNKTKKYFHW
jgi:tricorn protease